MTALIKQRTVEVIAFLLIVLFTYTAVSKLIAGAIFKAQLQKSPYLSDFAEEMAWLVPASEIIISFLLAFPASRILGLYASFFLLCAFTAYIYAILHFSSFVPCACGGILASLTWNQHLLVNTGFIAISIVGILLSPARQKKTPGIMKQKLLLIACLLVGATLVLTALHYRLEDPNDQTHGFTRKFNQPELKRLFSHSLPLSYNRIIGHENGRIWISCKQPGLLATFITNNQKYEEFIIPSELTSRITVPFYTLLKDSNLIILGSHSRKILRYNVYTKTFDTTVANTGNLLDAVALNRNSIILRTIAKGTTTPQLEKLSVSSGLLQQEKGISDTTEGAIIYSDGQLIIDPLTQHMNTYCYYKNQVTSFDSSFSQIVRSTTIDTHSYPTANVRMSAASVEIAKPPLLIHKSATAYNGKLYIHATLRGELESRKTFMLQDVIDIYQQKSLTYMGSFYLPKQDNKSIISLHKSGQQLFVLYPGKLICYSLTDG